MTPIVVDTAADVVDSKDGATSLREALILAQSDGRDAEITFDEALKGERLVLTQGQLEIDRLKGALTVDGDLDRDGKADITIDADGGSRVLDIAGHRAADAEVALNGLVITGGRTEDSAANGGGINAAYADLSIRNSAIIGNATTGDSESGSSANTPLAQGGGIYAYRTGLEIDRSTISGNSTSGDYGYGGGLTIVLGELDIDRSSISENSTSGYFGVGAGLTALRTDSTITRSAINDNLTTGVNADGAGIAAEFGTMTIDDSTVGHNVTTGDDSDGGGLAIVSLDIDIANSTLAENVTTGLNAFGGAVASGGTIPGRAVDMKLTNTTVTGNAVADGAGAGLAINGIGDMIVENSIVAGNAVDNSLVGGPDTSDVLGGLTESNGGNLFGQEVVNGASPDDRVGVDPATVFARTEAIGQDAIAGGVLADNGGRTETVALAKDGPAIDAAVDADALDTDGDRLVFDQRGLPRAYDAVEGGGAVDIGSYEHGDPEDRPGLTPYTSLAEQIESIASDDLALVLEAVLGRMNGGDDTLLS
ncbi:choice-of-anchor Q domain-containing protein [Marinivivus vitaminiproducens]|uniref:choice-of-anchor Q domain-containing protein n=1 Tax=Marinivivus vitaminiproducens TaxID=3035935 RepID=UPI0027A3649D|nr:right-handed parallel beta-helix repeat-containing protein [Geminicoccaceae bacterium SCSIO 64248]